MPGTYTLPSGTTGFFYNAGGPDVDFISNIINNATTISPENVNDKISVSFSYFRESYPYYLEVHDGNSIAAPLLDILTSSAGYGTITASPSNATGSLTFKPVYALGRWAAVIATNSSPHNISMPGTYILPSGTTGFFYDNGGPGANYSSNNMVPIFTTIYPSNDSDKISVSFNYFETYSGDYIEIHDGNISAPLLGKFSGTTNPGTITSSATDGSLTFKFVSNINNFEYAGWAAVIISIHDTTSVGVENDESNIPKVFGLDQNYPNPFNPSTSIEYQVPVSSFVELKVFDLLGREVATLVNEEKNPGNYETTFDGSKLASGVYFYRIKANPSAGSGQSFVQTKKLLLMK